MGFSRRNFLTTSALASLALGLEAQTAHTSDRTADDKPAEQRSQAIPVTGKTVIITKRTKQASFDSGHAAARFVVTEDLQDAAAV